MSPFSEGQNRYALMPLFLAGVLFVLLAPLFWLNSGVPEGAHAVGGSEYSGLYDCVFPIFRYGFTRLQEGELSLWNPMQWCGTPYFANPATGLIQPLNVVFLLVKTEQALAVQGFLSMFLMGLFFALFARALGTGYVPAVIGGIVYAFGGTAATALAHPEILPVLAWTPLALWAIREFSRTGHYGIAVIGGIILALMAVGCAVQAFAAMLCIVVPYALLRMLAGNAPFFRRTAGFLLMLVIALLVSALQWAPSLSWLIQLDNPLSVLGPYDLAGIFPSKLREIPFQCLAATPDVLPRPGYLGTATLLLIPLALFQRHARLEALFFLLASALLFPAAALGHSLWGGRLPLEVLVFPAALAVAVLAALGANRLFAAGRDTLSPLVWIPPMIVLALAAGLFIAASAPMRGRLIPFAAVVFLFLLLRLRPVGVFCALLTASLLFIDLYAAGVRYYPHPFAEPITEFADHARLYQAAQEQSLDGRILMNTHPSDKKFTANLGLLAPLRSAGGSRWPLTRDQARWWAMLSDEKAGEVSPRAAQPELLNYMAVRVLLAAAEPFVPEGWETRGVRLRPARSETGLNMYLNETALPRCYWTPGWRAVSGIEEVLKVLGDPGFDGRRNSIVEPNSPAFAQLAMLAPNGAAAADAPNNGVCTIREDTPGRVVVRVEAPQAGLTILADTYDPGWIATLNGKPVPILKVNGLFRGIATPAGGSTIVFVYRPLTFWFGLALSLAALATLTLMGVGMLFRRRQLSPN